MKRNIVRDWMSPNPVIVDPKTPLPEAHKLMRERKVRRLPVVEEGRVVGIITIGDVREAQPSDATSLSIYELNYLLAKLTVDRVMTREVITISPDASIRDAARVMLERKLGGLPVIENGKLVGIITESDVFRVLVQQDEPA